MSTQFEVMQKPSEQQTGDCCGATSTVPPSARQDALAIREEVQSYYGEVAELQLTEAQPVGLLRRRTL